MKLNCSRGLSRLGWLVLVAPLPIAALAWRAATPRATHPPAARNAGIVNLPAVAADDTPASKGFCPMGRCRLRTATGPVTCEFGNRDDPGFGMAYGTGSVRFRWRTSGGRWATNTLEPRRGYAFLDHSGVRLEATKDPQGGAVILINVICPFGSAESLLTTAVRLDPGSARPRVLGQFEDGEEPSGYLASPRRGTILFWSSYSDPNAAHVAPHTFSFVEYRIERTRWTRLWSRTTQRKYDWNPDEESRYLRSRREDPLHEIGRRWPLWWTEQWKPRSSRGVVRF